MKYILLTLIFAIFNIKTFAQAHSPMAIESWLKMECKGPIVPRRLVWPATSMIYPPMQSLITYYLQIDPNQKIPKMKELYQKYPAFFETMTKTCTEKRFALIDQNGPSNGNWPQWGTDWEYSRLFLSTVNFYNQACREANSPCQNTSQCCPNKGLTCDRVTQSCKGPSTSSSHPSL